MEPVTSVLDPDSSESDDLLTVRSHCLNRPVIAIVVQAFDPRVSRRSTYDEMWKRSSWVGWCRRFDR
jgi:hypothetical protein